MKITFLGHSAVLVEGSKTLLFDPFLTGNPSAAVMADELSPDLILLSHGHGDHLGDAIPIATRSGCEIVAPTELASYCQQQGVKACELYMGGSAQYGPELTVTMVAATHGSSLYGNGPALYLGEAAGFIVKIDGKTLYFAGDTGLTYDMKAVIGDRYQVDLAILPIGGKFTMGPEEAAVAAGWLGAKQVLPVHYNTFPLIRQDGQAFKQRVEQADSHCTVCLLSPGQSLLL